MLTLLSRINASGSCFLSVTKSNQGKKKTRYTTFIRCQRRVCLTVHHSITSHNMSPFKEALSLFQLKIKQYKEQVKYIFIFYLVLVLASLSAGSTAFVQWPIDQSVTFPVNFSFVISSPDNFMDPIREPIYAFIF